MSDFALEIVQMYLSGNSEWDVSAILDVPFEQVEEIILAWDDLTDDDRDVYKSNMEF